MDKEEKYSFIIEFDEMADKQINNLTDYFNNNEIKFHVLKSNYELEKQKEAIDHVVEYIEKEYYSKNTVDIDSIGLTTDKLLQVRKFLKEVSE